MEYTELTDDEMLQINKQRRKNIELEHYQHGINRQVAIDSLAMSQEEKDAAVATADKAMKVLEEQIKAAEKEVNKIEGRRKTLKAPTV